MTEFLYGPRVYERNLRLEQVAEINLTYADVIFIPVCPKLPDTYVENRALDANPFRHGLGFTRLSGV
jgi:hypothetical protein